MINIFSFRPVVYLPGKEFSVAVRFSPMKYELRPVKRQAAKKQISPETSLQDQKESIKDSETEERLYEVKKKLLLINCVSPVQIQSSLLSHLRRPLFGAFT